MYYGTNHFAWYTKYLHLLVQCIASLVFFLGVEKPLEIPSKFFFSHFIYFKLIFNWGGVRELLYSVVFLLYNGTNQP